MKIKEINLTELIKFVKENNVEVTLIIKANGEQEVSIKPYGITWDTVSTPCISVGGKYEDNNQLSR